MEMKETAAQEKKEHAMPAPAVQPHSSGSAADMHQKMMDEAREHMMERMSGKC